MVFRDFKGTSDVKNRLNSGERESDEEVRIDFTTFV